MRSVSGCRHCLPGLSVSHPETQRKKTGADQDSPKEKEQQVPVVETQLLVF